MRKKVHAMLAMARANLDSWVHSPRTGIMLMFVISFVYVVCTNQHQAIARAGLDVHWAETLYDCLSKGCNITMTSILFLITVSELPKKSNMQYSMLIRSSRAQWLGSQIIYCLLMALGMLALVTLCAMLFILPGVSAGTGWSDDARIEQGLMLEEQALVPAFIRARFSPLGACGCALLPMFLFWFSMVLLILLFSLYNRPLVGLLAYAVMLLGHLVFLVEAFDQLPLPIYYATLGNILSGWVGEEEVRLRDAFLLYVAALTASIALMVLRVRRMDYQFMK